MNLLLANNPREKYQIGDTIPGTLNNGMMEKVAAMMPQLERCCLSWTLYSDL